MPNLFQLARVWVIACLSYWDCTVFSNINKEQIVGNKVWPKVSPIILRLWVEVRPLHGLPGFMALPQQKDSILKWISQKGTKYTFVWYSSFPCSQKPCAHFLSLQQGYSFPSNLLSEKGKVCPRIKSNCFILASNIFPLLSNYI